MSRTPFAHALSAAALLLLLGVAAAAAPAPAGAQLRPIRPATAEQLARRLTLLRATLTAPEHAAILTRVPVRFEVTHLASEAYLVTVYSELSTPSYEAPCRGGHPPEVHDTRQLTPVDGTLAFADTLFFYESANGQTCPLHVALRKLADPYGQRDTLYAGSVRIDRLESYTVSQTWSLIPYVAAIVPRNVGGASGSCSGVSLGLSGAVPIGVVEYDHDISIHIRSRINRAECVFDSAEPQPRLNAGWTIVDRRWAVERARGAADACEVDNYSADQPARQYFYVHAQMRCGGGPDNDSGVRLTLKSVTLLGPPGKSALDAFAR